MNSRFLIFLLLIMSSVAHSQNKEFSYTYLELNATQSEDIGYVATISVGLPASIYLKGSVKNEDVKSKETLFQKTGQLVAIGYHSSIADIFKSVSKSGFSFNFARIMDVYAEIGANTWELENLENGTKGSTDAYVQAGIKMGNAEGGEFLGDLVHTWTKSGIWTIPINVGYVASYASKYLKKELKNYILVWISMNLVV